MLLSEYTQLIYLFNYVCEQGDEEEGRKEKKKKHRHSDAGSGSNSPVSKKVKA